MLLKSLVLVSFLANHAWAGCNRDNLLNAFVKSSSQAAAFCSTYQSGSPLPTFVPTTYSISRYLSACSCIATTATSTTTTTSSKSTPTSTSCLCPVCDPYISTVTVTATLSSPHLDTTTQAAATVTVTASSVPYTVTIYQTTSTLFEADFTTTQSTATITSTVTVTQTSSASLEVDFTTTQPASTITITAACSSTSTTSTAPSCPSPSFSCSGVCNDLTSDPNNCGACGRTCYLANAAAICTNSQCAIAACNVGFSDCDNNPSNGCETDIIQDPASCGACGHQCSSNNGTPFCSDGICGINCAPGFMNCNNNVADGCEINTLTDKNNCGSCANICSSGLSSASCVSGVCH